jgi:hypothetical protein
MALLRIDDDDLAWTDVLSARFWRNKQVHQSKYRVMLIREQHLRDIASGQLRRPQFENTYHIRRWKTLKTMAEMFAEQQDLREGTPEGLTHSQLVRVEICFPSR